MSEFRKFCIGYWIASTAFYFAVRYLGDETRHSFEAFILSTIWFGLSIGSLAVVLGGKSDG